MHHLTKKLTALALFGALALFPATWALAGDLDAPAAPTDTGSAMYTLEDIYNRLNNNTQATKRTGGFAEPSAAPGSTGHTLDEVYEKAIPTQVPKTGQTTCSDKDGNLIGCAGTGQDGALQRGVAWPDTRFTDNDDGTVTDNLTNLVWLKNADCFENSDWTTALDKANGLADGACGLSDGSEAGDWWLPNSRELFSLIDKSQHTPALPSDHQFKNVRSDGYWSSTTSADDNDKAWAVDMSNGNVVGGNFKVATGHVWPVRARE